MINNTDKEENQLTRFREELRDGTWLIEVRKRSQRRKSAWNLLLPLFGFPLWGAISAALIWLVSSLRISLHPTSAQLLGSGPIDTSGALVLIPSLIAAVCPALIITNALVYLIAPARRAMDTEDRDFPGTGYTASQKALLRAGLWVFAVCFPIALVGALLV